MAENARECFDHLLRSLHEGHLGWIAGEIEAEIAAGRVVEKEWRESARRVETGLAVEEYSDPEKLRLALQILIERVQVAHAVWSEAAEHLQHRLGITSTSFVDSDTEQTFEPFTNAFPAALSELEDVLKRIASECELHGPEVDRLSMRPARSLVTGR